MAGVGTWEGGAMHTANTALCHTAMHVGRLQSEVSNPLAPGSNKTHAALRRLPNP